MMLRVVLAAGAVAAVGVMMAASADVNAQPTSASRPGAVALVGIHKIRHIIVIMQENRSFDSYFGTYPGARGIPRGVCVRDPRHGGCVRPYADHHDSNKGGPHETASHWGDVDSGKMDGFVARAEVSCAPGSRCRTDVMGHHTGRDIPNYWAYAKHFVLDDRMYESPTPGACRPTCTRSPRGQRTAPGHATR